MTYIYLITLAALAAYREIQILIDRGSWKIEMTWLPIWYTEWNSMWKLFDSFHLIEGLYTLILCAALTKLNNKSKWYFVIVYWALYYYARNIFMHIIFMNPEYMRFKFLIPIIQ